MKKITVLSIGVILLALLGVVHGASFPVPNHGDVAVTTSDAFDESSAPARLAKRSDGCFCCWVTRGVKRCRWTTHSRCRLRGGRCEELSSRMRSDQKSRSRLAANGSYPSESLMILGK